MQAIDRYRGQWGGKTANGEEMWWSEPDHRLMKDTLFARLRYATDVRQHFIIKLFKKFTRNYSGLRSTSGLDNATSSSVFRCIDFGCGTGGTTLNLAKFLGISITGFDLFPTQLEIASSFAEKEGISCRFESLVDGQIPLPDSSVDAVFSFDVLGHVPDPEACLKEWARVLKQDGAVILFTEADFSTSDRSTMARLAHRGHDMLKVVPEHISLKPREILETYFRSAGLNVTDRISANVGHLLFFPKDYVTLLRKLDRKPPVYWIALIWDRIYKITPFYPWPFQWLRLLLTNLFGRQAYGTGYFYLLRKR